MEEGSAFYVTTIQEPYNRGRANRDYYDRLIYIAADRSERMLLDVVRHGVLAHHPGCYRLRVVDAMCPEKELPYDYALRDQPCPQRPFRAVFLNYLLDCLPAAVLQFDGDMVKELQVRTCVARNIKLEDFTDLSVEQLKKRAQSDDPRARQELLEVYGLFASEYDYRPVDAQQLPYGKFGVEYARSATSRFLLSYGAIGSLEKLLALTAEDGFILINDYGQTMTTRQDEFEHQRFSLATFVGVNFPLLKAYFDRPTLTSSGGRGGQEALTPNPSPGVPGEGGRNPGPSSGERGETNWIEPHSEEGGIHTRLLCHHRLPDTVLKFWECFSKARYDHLHEPIAQARACARVGRFELAATYYNQALERQPGNWVLLNEISMFLTFSLRDARAGIDMAKMALALNPACSAELWNTLGDGLFAFGRCEEARSAYEQALRVNESDVRSRYNLAWCHAQEKNYPEALEALAQALALDRSGEYRERLIQKHAEVLGQLGQRHQQEYLLLINLVSKYASKPEDAETQPQRGQAARTENGDR